MTSLLQDIAAYSISALIPIVFIIYYSYSIRQGLHYPDWLKSLSSMLYKPLLSTILTYSAHLFFIYSDSMNRMDYTKMIFMLDNIIYLLLVGSLFWLILSVSKLVMKYLNNIAIKHNSKMMLYLLPIIYKSIYFFIVMFLVNWVLIYLIPIHVYHNIVSKIMKITLILLLSWIFIQIVYSIELLVIKKYGSSNLENLKSRKIFTQFEILKRIILALIFILAFTLILMTFDNMRVVGETLLASAGVIAAITTFAAQKTLTNLFSGLNIALTQPVRINDTVVIENEFGTVEEITLTYIVVKIWDLRKLVVPINYFIEKPFMNWTKDSTELIGTIYLYLDHSCPIEKLRNELTAKIKDAALWNKKLLKLEVTEIREYDVELRMLVSADNATDLWNLRCEIREVMMNLIKDNYLDYLPKMRFFSSSS